MQKTTLTIAASLLASVSTAASAHEKLYIYNWADYFGETTIADFEAEFGIDVVYDTFSSNDVLETKLLAGGSGYDVVFPSSERVGKQIEAGAYQPLDIPKLTNIGNVDPQFLGVAASVDRGNQYTVPYTWGTLGIYVDNTEVADRMPDAPIDSWEVIFNPEIVKRFADCGFFVQNSSSELIPAALTYLGREPGSVEAEDLDAAMNLLNGIRPYLLHSDNSRVISDIATGETCLGVVYNGDVGIAYLRADEAGRELDISYSVPKEGTDMFMDVMAIPVDAPNPDAAHKFINYILRPEVAAGITNYVYYANANAAATDLVIEDVRMDPGTYPPADLRKKLYGIPNYPVEFARIVNRKWTRLMSGQ
ncbi:extracellular solute-binding protein [Defluviimonas aestuarii]|uniref:extracellular solute-binding protein n=1 Tax=Albidovulum aestuarii TaxID=1130726 RepID=UPI00249B6F46|nr:extracellular solute-binding protein [Defluviimonas aestuarii]MDI3337152.1 extracellular solute-binding protein [Defluviimonas aestuarii]